MKYVIPYAFLSMIVLSSCTVKKRRYRSGYHINWPHHKTKHIKQEKNSIVANVKIPIKQTLVELVSFEKSKIHSVLTPDPLSQFPNDLMASQNLSKVNIPTLFLRNSKPLTVLYFTTLNSVQSNIKKKGDKKKHNKLTVEDKVVLILVGFIVLFIIGFILYNSLMSSMSFGGTLIWI